MATANLTHVLVTETGDYHLAGTLPSLRKAYKRAVAQGQSEESLKLYLILNGPEKWVSADAIPESGIEATLKTLKENGLDAVGVTRDDVVQPVKNIGATLKTGVPGLGRALLDAAKGATLEKMKLTAAATRLLGQLGQDAVSLAATGRVATEKLQTMLQGEKPDAVVTPEGQRMLSTAWLENSNNAQKLSDLSLLNPKAPKP